MARRRFEERTLPTESDINVFDSLDERWAVERFLGKRLDEIEERCRDGFAMDVIQDLMWIGPAAFAYYVEAVADYLVSDASADDSDAVNCFVGTLEFRLEHESDEAVPWTILIDTIDHVMRHYDRYNASPELYGDLRLRYAALRTRILSRTAP